MSSSRHSLPRWALSLALVLGLHIGIGVLALHWRNPAQAVEMPPAAMLIELAPLPAVTPPPPPAPVAEPLPEPLPPPVVAPKPKLVLEKPKPKARPKPPKPVVTPPKTPPQPAPPAPSSEPSTAPATAPSAPAAASASVSSAANQAARQSWQSRLLGHLARYKRYPTDARRRGIEGTSQVRFSLDGNGRVLSIELARSSGNASLDRATLAMIRRASPVPKPPAELLNAGQLEIVAPFIYSLERG